MVKLATIALLLLSSASAFESHLKVRMHKDVIQNFFSKNFDILLSRVEKDQEKDVKLEELGGVFMTDVHIGMRPARNLQWSELTPLETFFDDTAVIFEGHDLEFQGRANIQDPETEAIELITFHAPLSTCQIVISLGEEYASWGSLYPRLNIEQVLFQVDESLLSVSAAGELPLYQTHNFEKAVKKWFLEGIQKRQREFKQSL